MKKKKERGEKILSLNPFFLFDKASFFSPTSFFSLDFLLTLSIFLTNFMLDVKGESKGRKEREKEKGSTKE